jgi:hypothetical protein
MAVAEALAVLLNVVYLILVYYWIFVISKALYRRGVVWLVAFLIFLSPFAFSLIVVDGLAGLIKALYKRGVVWLIAFLIFLSPFAFSLIVVDGLAGLMWVLALTPFISVVILIVFFTNWMLLYYGLAYGILAVSYFVLRKIRSIRA